jgi:hypothetical protein
MCGNKGLCFELEGEGISLMMNRKNLVLNDAINGRGFKASTTLHALKPIGSRQKKNNMKRWQARNHQLLSVYYHMVY